MVDFKTKFNNYIKSTQAHILGISNTKSDGINYIKAALMSVFDGNTLKNGYRDGKIDKKEFYNIKQSEYENIVNEMKTYYQKLNNKELEYHIPTYSELEQMLLDGQEQNQTTKISLITSSEITLDEIEEPIVPNKTIGQVNQESSGECYQDASNIALSFKKKGIKLLERSVKTNFIDGGYDVTLYGAKRNGVIKPVTYHFTKEQLRDAQSKMVKFKDGYEGKKYSSGDANIVLLDLAVEKYRKDNNHKLLARNTRMVKGFDDYLSSGFIHENLELITGKKGFVQTYTRRVGVENSAEGRNKGTDHTYLIGIDINKKINNKLKSLSIHNDSEIAGCTFGVTKDGNWKEFKQYGLFEAHVFAIESVNLKKGIVYISNPHSSNAKMGKGSQTINPIPIDIFKKYVSTISWINID